jgi:hypothetical protein
MTEQLGPTKDEPETPKHKAWGCDCAVCREWRLQIYLSGRWPRPRYYNGERHDEPT